MDLRWPLCAGMAADYCRKRFHFAPHADEQGAERFAITGVRRVLQPGGGSRQGGAANETGVGEYSVGGIGHQFEIRAACRLLELFFRFAECDEEEFDLPVQTLASAVRNVFEKRNVDPG